ncbi:motility protein A [Pokkaliibacter sp. CJK22405]|uniref:motility protein A n=1 Tax=Pokkaliibacter sp. CJK22405 TaxID=3384615 RepID=UPI003984C76B
MDFASILGIVSGLALIISAIFMGGDFHIFINVPGIMIVVGGTIAATLLTFQFKDVISAFRGAFHVFSQERSKPLEMINTMLDLSKVSHRNGLLALANVETNSKFLKRACNMMADAASEEFIRRTLQTEIDSLIARHYTVQDIFKKMASYAPAFGMLGTLIGLVQMLSQLDDPASIGPAMAVALLTTFYGSMMSTMLFLPIAGKLRSRTMMEVQNLEIIREGAISILSNDNYLNVYERLSSYIPEAQRQSVSAKKGKK